MSFILDALRKSEHERQRSAVPGLAQVPLAAPPARLPPWVLVVIGVLAAAVLVLGGAWWQSTRAPAVTAASPPTVERRVELPPAPPADRVATLQSPPQELTAPVRANALAAAAGPASTEPAAAEPSFTPPPAAPAPPDEPALPSAIALAAEGIILPEMRLELHAFRTQPRDRFVFINGRKYVEGERLVEGPQLVSIAPTGAVLVHAGRRFLLTAE